MDAQPPTLTPYCTVNSINPIARRPDKKMREGSDCQKGWRNADTHARHLVLSMAASVIVTTVEHDQRHERRSICDSIADSEPDWSLRATFRSSSHNPVVVTYVDLLFDVGNGPGLLSIETHKPTIQDSWQRNCPQSPAHLTESFSSNPAAAWTLESRN